MKEKNLNKYPYPLTGTKTMINKQKENPVLAEAIDFLDSAYTQEEKLKFIQSNIDDINTETFGIKVCKSFLIQESIMKAYLNLMWTAYPEETREYLMCKYLLRKYWRYLSATWWSFIPIKGEYYESDC